MTVVALERQIRVMRLKGIVAAGAATGLAIVTAILVSSAISGNQSEAQRTALARALAFSTCTRGNVVRAYLWRDAAESVDRPAARLAQAQEVFPILDCQATVREGTGVPLPRALQVDYVRRTVPPL